MKSKLSSLLLTLLLLFPLIVPRSWIDSLHSSLVQRHWQEPPSDDRRESLILEEWLRLKEENADLRQRLLSLASLPPSLPSQKVSPAHVISPPSSHHLWINRGQSSLPEGMGSLVLSGGAFIGIIDKIEENQSRVLLISSPKMRPSVRAAREGEETLDLSLLIERLIHHLSLRDLPHDPQQLRALARGREYSPPPFLGHGPLRGAIHSEKSFPLTLSGEYFPEESMNERKGDLSLPLLAPGDLLVATGMDGFLPEGLPIAYVTECSPYNREKGGYTLQAALCAGNLRSIERVIVVSPSEKIDISRS
ncbi:MAG: hypothetical protein VXZ72_01850 [Chlamydiota bacterium]|nr:hypothetical protein [Chlamydiota bacterium]